MNSEGEYITGAGLIFNSWTKKKKEAYILKSPDIKTAVVMFQKYFGEEIKIKKLSFIDKILYT
jgi:hypothetical protein